MYFCLLSHLPDDAVQLHFLPKGALCSFDVSQLLFKKGAADHPQRERCIPKSLSEFYRAWVISPKTKGKRSPRVEAPGLRARQREALQNSITSESMIQPFWFNRHILLQTSKNLNPRKKKFLKGPNLEKKRFCVYFFTFVC